MNEWLWIIFQYGLAVICGAVIVLLIRKSKNRKKDDKPTPQHKHTFKAPTWRFQKFHPDRCPHHNGIYRNIEIKVLDRTIKKTIFVCADCIDAIEIDEIKDRDKFK